MSSELIRGTWAEYSSKLYHVMKMYNEYATGQEYTKAMECLWVAERLLGQIKEGLLVEIAYGRPDIEFWQKWFTEGDVGVRELVRRPPMTSTKKPLD